MTTQTRCAQCGASFAPREQGHLRGLCPGCVAGFVLSPGEETQSPAPLKPGTLFHGLEVQELIGRGGMGFVYRARHPGLDRLVALKVLSPDLAADPDFARRFEREARTLARLDHPNIVRVTDFGREGEHFFLIMEHVDGSSLRELLKARRLAPSDTLLLVPQVCDALHYAHSAGVVHRDIKPENILVDRQGRVKVADFGLARMAEEPGATRLTRTEVVMGTPAYMAPEQHEARPVDHRADIYSLGVVFYELLTGELPVGRFQPPSERPRVDSRLDPDVLKSLEKDPGRRFQSAGEVKDQITGLIPRKLRRRWVAAGLGLGLAAAIALVILLSGRTRPTGKANPQKADSPERPTWIELDGSASGGGISANAGISAGPSVALDASDRPVVAWQDTSSGNSEIYVKGWNGRKWTEFGESGRGGGVSSTPGPSVMAAMALDKGGHPWVTWSGNGKIYLRRWDGTGWTEVGGSVSGGGISRTPGRSIWPCLALDVADRAVVAWTEQVGPLSTIYVRHWDGSAWVELGGSATGLGICEQSGGTATAMALDTEGNPYVAWHGGRSGSNVEVRLKRWDGRKWSGLGDSASAAGISDSPGKSWKPSLALDLKGRPVVAWRDDSSGNFEVYLRRWNGTAWEELGGSASEGGVSRTASHSNDPSVAIDSGGNPWVAWQETLARDKIYLRRWDGSGWVEVEGSASGGGVSSTPGWSKFPSLRLDSQGRPVVAWQDDSSGNFEIYLRRFASK